jgi:hypothetical protein
MTAVTIDPTVLRFGPYRPPRFKRGDRAFCFYRDADVVVTTWTAARIPWPRCQVPGVPGGSGLLITDELKRAILSESAEALKHWFGVGTKAVWNWRRAFGVSRLGTPGSKTLRLEQNRANVPAANRGTRTPRERRRRRVTALRLDLARHVRAAAAKRWEGRGLTPEQLALLGTAPDAELAMRLGRSESAVRQRRERLGIPLWDRRDISGPAG